MLFFKKKTNFGLSRVQSKSVIFVETGDRIFVGFLKDPFLEIFSDCHSTCRVRSTRLSTLSISMNRRDLIRSEF